MLMTVGDKEQQPLHQLHQEAVTGPHKLARAATIIKKLIASYFDKHLSHFLNKKVNKIAGLASLI